MPIIFRAQDEKYRIKRFRKIPAAAYDACEPPKGLPATPTNKEKTLIGHAFDRNCSIYTYSAFTSFKCFPLSILKLSSNSPIICSPILFKCTYRVHLCIAIRAIQSKSKRKPNPVSVKNQSDPNPMKV